MGIAITGGVVRFPTTQTGNVDLSFFPTTMTRYPGTAKSSTRPWVTTLRRGNDALETRHLLHPRARNSVVLSILLKVVQMNGIARKKRYTVVTSSRRPMSRQLVCSSNVPSIWRGLGEAIFRRSFGAGGSPAWLLSSTCGQALGVLCTPCWQQAIVSSRCRTEALLSAFPAAVHLKRVDVHAEMFQPLLRRRSASVILVGGKSPCHNPTSHQPHQLARPVQDITNLPEARDAFTQVVGWLETTSSVPDEVKCKYDELLNAQHFEIAAF